MKVFPPYKSNYESKSGNSSHNGQVICKEDRYVYTLNVLHWNWTFTELKDNCEINYVTKTQYRSPKLMQIL